MNRRYRDEDTLLNVSEAADFLRASRTKLYRLARSGELTAYKVGATYVFYLRDLHAFVRRQTAGKDAAGDS